jgi:hypothetical protein
MIENKKVLSSDPDVIRVIFIRKIGCNNRYNFVAEVKRLNVGSVIRLGGTGYAVGMTNGTEVFDIDCFSADQWRLIFSGKET